VEMFPAGAGMRFLAFFDELWQLFFGDSFF
jgi:hypothetical protein